MPVYLYHATPEKNAKLIKTSGYLKPMSTFKGKTYLHMAAKEANAATLRPQPDDIMLRVMFSTLNPALWECVSKERGEWRGTESIGIDLLEYRKKLSQKDDPWVLFSQF